MKNIILYSLLLGSALLLPRQGTDVGKLLPVELISIYKEADAFVIATDAGATGTGDTIENAVMDMKATAAANVYLDTADFLLISDLSDEEVETLREILKPSIRVCETEGRVSPKRAADYLRIHRPEQRLGEWTRSNPVQLQIIEGGKLFLGFFEKT